MVSCVPSSTAAHAAVRAMDASPASTTVVDSSHTPTLSTKDTLKHFQEHQSVPHAVVSASVSSNSESDRENEDDALVPSSPSFKKDSSPTPAEEAAAHASSAPKSHAAFYTSTPTPKPPPRLAPMPRSPPPRLVIHTQQNNSAPATPVLAPISRYASAYHAHNRSVSQSQAHPNHGNNIFTYASRPPLVASSISSPSLASLSGADASAGAGSGSSLNDSHIDDGTGSISRGHIGSNSTISHASFGVARSVHHSPLHPQPHLAQQQQQHHRHHHHHHQQQQPPIRLHRHAPFQNDLLTPSSSQTSLVSNLPSPLIRSSLSPSSSFRDPAPISSSHLGLTSWVSSQPDSSSSGGSMGDDISESSLFPQAQPGPSATPVSASDAAAPTSSASSRTVAHSNQPYQQQQHELYSGLQNTVGPYKLVRTIGQGSFSEVKLAIDIRTGDHVAVKVMNRATIQSSDRLGVSVRRESDLLKSIQHSNVIGFREVVETPLQTCIVLEYASGGELFEFVSDNRAKACEQDIQFIFAQVVDDIMLVPRAGAPLRPTIKLTDFGLAKVIEQDAPLLTTRCGSEDYAAPEIILGQPYDGREADIWSLGVVLYALLVGFLPFNMRPGMSRKSFLSMIARAEFGFPGEKVSTKRVSPMSPRERSLSTASTSSSTNASSSDLTSASGTLSPTSVAAALDTSFARNEDTTTMTMIVPKMHGVSPVSDESKDLVRWLLQTKGSARPTAKELRNHPWVVAGLKAVHESHMD
ncbi:hypothetical protein BGZ50_006133 [Haplosporangium sp. Z 11]|nr:hypothetical protein BGZ50_006133 [Haplosporangium sp. Z 11]